MIHTKEEEEEEEYLTYLIIRRGIITLPTSK